MTDSIISTLIKMGMPVGIVSLLVLLFRLSPITLLTSSPVEKVLYSKEKRLTITVTIYMGQLLLTCITILYFSLYFYGKQNLYSNFVSVLLLIIIFLGFVYLLWQDFRNRNFSQMFGHSSTKKKLLFIFCWIFYIVILLFLPAYYLGTQLLSVSMTTNSNSELDLNFFYLLTLAAILSLLISICILSLIKVVLKFMDVRRNTNSVYFLDENAERWYVYHPIGDDKLLLGNTSTQNNCSVYCIRERNDVIRARLLIDVTTNSNSSGT